MTTTRQMQLILETHGFERFDSPGFESGHKDLAEGEITLQLFSWSANRKAAWGKELLANGELAGYLVLCFSGRDADGTVWDGGRLILPTVNQDHPVQPTLPWADIKASLEKVYGRILNAAGSSHDVDELIRAFRSEHPNLILA